MPELTDAQKVLRNDTGKRMADALEALAGTGSRGLPAGGADGNVLVKNGATNYAARWSSTPPQMGSLAMIETSPATAAHEVGEYIVLNGQLYKVTAAIAAGQTLTPGTNISAVSNGGLNDLTKTASEKPTALQSFNSNYSLVKKVGRCAVCMLDFQGGNFIVNSGDWYNIAQVSSDFFPDMSVGYVGYGYLMKSDYSIIPQTFQLQATGIIRASILSGTYIRAFAQIAYFTN